MRVNTGPGVVENLPVPSTNLCTEHRAHALLANFDIDDATVKPQHKQWLDENVVPFVKSATRIALNGTASRSGSDKYNQGLSERRVKAVKEYLVLKGASPSVITAEGAGEQPAAAAGDKDGTENPRFRAVKVFLEAKQSVVVTVRVHPIDAKTRKVPSIRGRGGKDHFVAAKNNSGVFLQADIKSLTCVPANLTWEAENEAGIPLITQSPALGGDPLTVRLDSSVSRRITLRLLGSGSVLWEGFVWIVFATITAVPETDLLTDDGVSLTIGQGFAFTHTISPQSITQLTDDIPDLTGPKVTPLPEGTNHAGKTLQGGADRKWDNSRKIRKKFLNPDNIPMSQIGNNSFNQTFPNFPSTTDGDGHPGGAGALDADLVAIVGNDDAGTGDPEDNDPYTSPNIGKLTGVDQPTRVIDHSAGSNGNTVEWRLHFLEFARLEISGKWFKISDDFPWRVHLKVKKVGGKWTNNGSLKELNINGF